MVSEQAIAANDLAGWRVALARVRLDMLHCADRVTGEGGVDREQYMNAAANVNAAVMVLVQLEQAAADAQERQAREATTSIGKCDAFHPDHPKSQCARPGGHQDFHANQFSECWSDEERQAREAG
jgi:hypothetical protein